ncbi:hypothetical protein L226DRAFT_576804 [Lentinus tigrinus ALCF2SS1-7]|uniref:Uncharacterized protein n=1 Tax=Lentinus tigrinus ALCF2SS1-6 TaxID=1328759 RepID=A0A5C2RMJ6_9APHY|nr:hypothetical protein L227DRAFT_617726 [Lentinus tigrinus ALCF2SS1-6]RPD67972.1 hypothetical protein L226DRAFT_576804 [Lentinus tigrinus ALCF2SS1-7]
MPSERRAVLRERQNAWHTLSWRSLQDISASQDSSGTSRYRLYDGVFALEENRRTLHFWQHPSHIRRIEEKKWTLDDVGVEITEFGLDPAQDLLVVVEEVEGPRGTLCRVHLRSLTTSSAHAMAASAVLVLTPGVEYYECSIQISNDPLALLWTCRGVMEERFEGELAVWNWKTGALIMDVSDSSIYSFVFLNTHYILLLSYYHCMYTQLDNSTIGPYMVVIELDKTPLGRSNDLTKLEYLCAFHYPSLYFDDTSFFDVTLGAYPGPGLSPPPSVAVPFSVSRDDRLLVVTMQVEYSAPEIAILLSFIPSSTLLSLIKTIPPGERHRRFAWEDWGPAGSRLQTTTWRPSFDSDRTACYGNSFARQVQTRPHPSPLSIELYDFNQLACRRMLGEGIVPGAGTSDGDGIELVMEPSVLTGPEKDIFREEVTTFCPYLRRQVVLDDQKDTLDALLLGED